MSHLCLCCSMKIQVPCNLLLLCAPACQSAAAMTAAPLSVQVYHPYLLMNKKRYAGLLWTSPDKWDKMDSKVGLPRCPMLDCGQHVHRSLLSGKMLSDA